MKKTSQGDGSVAAPITKSNSKEFDKNEYQKKWCEQNAEKRAEHQRRYREKKKKEISATKSNWYKKNAEKVKQKAREKYKEKVLNQKP